MDDFQKREVQDLLESLITGKTITLDREAISFPHTCKPLHPEVVDRIESVIRRMKKRKTASDEGKSNSQS
jgi:hypothetical protein